MADISTLIHGKKPEVAPFIPTDPIEMLRKLLTGEIQDWPQIAQLSNLYQTYMLQALGSEIPGFSDILAQGGDLTKKMQGIAAEELAGKIPQDVWDQVGRSSAFQNLQSGLLGGPMGQANQARNLGLTSLDMIKMGMGTQEAAGNAAQRWAEIAKGTIMPPSSQLYSPQWFSQFMAEQNAARQATQQYKFNVEAMPDPAWSDRAKLLATYGGMAIGGGMGGGGGGAGSSMNSFSQSFGGQGQNLGFGGNYQAAMAGAQPVGVGGAAGSAFSPWQPGSTDYYFPTPQSYQSFNQGGGFGGAGGFNTTPYQWNTGAVPTTNPFGG